MGDGGEDELGSVDGSQGDKTAPVGKRLQDRVREGEGQVCLADAPGAGQRDQAHLGTQEQVPCCC